MKRVLFNYLANIVNLSATIIVLPLINYQFGIEGLGCWVIYVTIGSLYLLAESALQPLLVNSVEGEQKETEYFFHSKAFLNESNFLCLKIAFFLGLPIYILGAIYVYYSFNTDCQAVFGWLIYGAGCMVSLTYSGINAFLIGRGFTYISNMTNFFGKISFLALTALLSLTGEQWTLSVAFFISVVLSKYLGYRILAGDFSSEKIVVQKMKIGSLIVHFTKLYITQVGTFLVQRSSILTAGAILTTSAAALYGSMVLVVSTIGTISSSIVGSHYSKFRTLWVEGNISKLISYYGSSLIISLVLYTLGAVSVLVIALSVGGFTAFSVSYYQVIVFMFLIIVYGLELNHTIAAQLIISTNNIPFALPAIISGIFTLILSILFAYSFGLIGLVFAQFIIQLVYNNWKWPKVVSESLNSSYKIILISGFEFLLQRLNFLQNKK